MQMLNWVEQKLLNLILIIWSTLKVQRARLEI